MLEFNEMTEEWLDFIVACRSGEAHDYDIVIGAMADDQIYAYVSDLYRWYYYKRTVLGFGKVQISYASNCFLHG